MNYYNIVIIALVAFVIIFCFILLAKVIRLKNQVYEHGREIDRLDENQTKRRFRESPFTDRPFTNKIRVPPPERPRPDIG